MLRLPFPILLRPSARLFSSSPPPFPKLLAANRGEIATRICRAATELDIKTGASSSKRVDVFVLR